MTLGLIPFRSEFSDFRREMDRLFGGAFGASNGEALAEVQSSLVPALDISENDQAYVATMEVPGIDEKDISVHLVGSTLTIKGEKRHLQEKKGDAYFYQERRYGKFQRQITLPERVEGDKIQARYKSGVLEVTIPKSPEAKPRSIKVEVS